MCTRLFAAVALTVCSLSGVHAGEVKFYDWPCARNEIPLCEIPAVLDTEPPRGSVVAAPVRLQPVGVSTFEGCSDVRIQCNCNLTVTCSIIPTGVIPGTYSASLSKTQIDAPGGIVKLCVKVTDAVPGSQPGRRSVTVAHVKLRVVARP